MDSLQDKIFGSQTGFQAFTPEHGIPILIFISSTILWIKFGKSWNEKKRFQSAFWFSLTLAFAVLWWMVFRSYTGNFDWKEDLPFHLCDILTLVIPIALYNKSRWFFAVLYFWVLAGTLQAVITPDLKEPFPHYMYLRYWWIHCGMISLVIYCLVLFKWKIYLKDIGYAILGANVYLVFSLITNLLTGGNYFFTMRKPDAVTLLDFLGPWPWYMLTGQLVMTGLFFLYYLPVWWWQHKGERIDKE